MAHTCQSARSKQNFPPLARHACLWLNVCMFKVDQLACLRGDRLLFRKLGLSLAGGALLRVTGANGTGKTSLLRLLAGLAVPAAGVIQWQSIPIHRQRDAFHAALFYLGHAAAINDLLTPVENLVFSCLATGLPVDRGQAREALIRLGLESQLELPCRVLSQGQRRRVALARLQMAGHQTLWILDEPFTALDQTAVSHLAGKFSEHCRNQGIVIFTSHQDVDFDYPASMLCVEDFAP